jgi:hypothetical protein
MKLPFKVKALYQSDCWPVVALCIGKDNDNVYVLAEGGVRGAPA